MQSTFLANRRVLNIACILLILILSGGVYTGYAVLDWFKDPRTIYLQSELKEIQNHTAVFEKLDVRYKNTIAPYLDKPVHTITELSDVAVEAESADPGLNKALELLKGARLTMDVQADERNKKADAKAELLLKDQGILNLELFTDANRLGLFIPELFNKYAYMDMKTSEQTKQDFPFLESVPEKMITYDDVMKAVHIAPEEFKPVLLDYGKFFSEQITAHQVTLNKNATFEEEAVKIPSREITVTFTESELKRLVAAMAEKLANDKMIQNLVYTRYHDVSELLKGAGYNVDELSKESFAAKWKDACFGFKQFFDEARLNEDARMVLYIDRNKNILSRTISLNVSSEKIKGSNSMVLKTGRWMDNDTRNGLFSFQTRTDRGEGGEVDITYSNPQEDAVNFDFKTTLTHDGKEEGMSGSVHSTVSQTEGGTDSSYRVKLNLADLKGSEGLKSISFQLSNRELHGQEVLLSVLTVDNSIDLAELTDADKTKLQKQLAKSGEQFAQNNADLFQNDFPLDKIFGMD